MSDGKTFMVEDAELLFKNFSGKEGQYNREGDRNFSVVLDEDVAEQLMRDGWNVKRTKPRESDEDGTTKPYIQISVNFGNRPPTIMMLTSAGRTRLSAENIEILDWADISQIDVIARGYDWTVNGLSGCKAYLKSLFVIIEEDALERKYANWEVEEVN